MRKRVIDLDDVDERMLALTQRQHQLLDKLASMEVRERSLLAEGIHDEPVQRIVASMLRLDTLAAGLNPAGRDELNKVAEQLEQAVDWLRNLIVVALSPPDLTEGLGPALCELARAIFAGSLTTFVVDGPDHVRLTVPAKEMAYRILREAMVNARKHARATIVTMKVDQADDVVTMTLSDNGVGSATLDAGPGHLGMATMRARADAEEGRLEIESIVGLGTVVTLTLPISDREPAGADRLAG
jgi:signal transduction histidine kinase